MKRLSALILLLGLISLTHADEKLKGIACRSVHLQYTAPEGSDFYNEITVKTSAKGTYFCVCGFSQGYYGIQELANGKKLLIFSVWDPGNQNDPNKVKDEDRVKLLHKHESVRIGRFGNEGTGGQSFYDYDWKVGETYQFLVRAKPDGDKHTAYSGYFFHPEKKEWLHLITYSTISKTPTLSGYYSFVEDFRRNKVSATEPREAFFSNGWVKTKSSELTPITKARFTADSNPVLNINAKVEKERFYLGTGGEIANDNVKLKEQMTRSPLGVKLPE
jgi:hypothetical protein